MPLFCAGVRSASTTSLIGLVPLVTRPLTFHLLSTVVHHVAPEDAQPETFVTHEKNSLSLALNLVLSSFSTASFILIATAFIPALSSFFTAVLSSFIRLVLVPSLAIFHAIDVSLSLAAFLPFAVDSNRSPNFSNASFCSAVPFLIASAA